jgi:Cys-tRNA(Pro)/Cys-tRNA(Cys) deacylase
MSGKGTPATLAVAEAGVAHQLHEYSHDPSLASYGLEAAEALGIDPGRVHKTLVVTVERNGRWELAVGVVPVDAQLDLKAIAMALGAKRADMAKAADVERSTGYVLGGISPLGQRKPLPTVIDEDAMLHDTIFVSAGRRGLEIELTADSLCALTNALYAPIAKR